MRALVAFKSVSYVEQVAIAALQKVINEELPPAFFSLDGTDDTNFDIQLALYGGWPEEPTRVPSIIVMAQMRSEQYAGLLANPYFFYNNESNIDQYVRFFLGQGTYTFVLQSHTRDLLYKMQNMFSYLLTSLSFRNLLLEKGVSLLSNYITWGSFTERSYFTLKYHVASANLDFRVEAVNGFTPDENAPFIETVSSEAEME